MEENNKLKTQVGDLRKMHHNEDADRNKFMEGASWMARKALQQNDNAINRVE